MNADEILKQVAQAAQTQHQPQVQIPPSPVPMAWQIAQVQSNQGNMIAAAVQTPMGQLVFFLDPETAKKIGEALIRYGGASGNELLLPS